MQEFITFLQQYWALSLTFIITLILLIIVEALRAKQGASQVNPGQLTQLINRENAVVIDIRPTDVYSKGHITEAISIPGQELKTSPKKLDKFKQKLLIIVCGNGIESRKTATALKNQGYNVYSLAGGIGAWKQANMPLVK